MDNQTSLWVSSQLMKALSINTTVTKQLELKKIQQYHRSEMHDLDCVLSLGDEICFANKARAVDLVQVSYDILNMFGARL